MQNPVHITSQMLRGLTILLVDDEKFSRDIVARMLRGLGCLNVMFAEDGAEALQVLSAGNSDVDMIISDFNMPVVHGLQLLRAIRGGSKGVKRATPFAMLTGYSDKRLVDLALALDVNAFLVKPISKDALEKRLTKLLAQVKSDAWLKDTENYKFMDVDGVLEAIATPESDQARAAGSEILPKRQPLFRSTKMAPDTILKSKEKSGPVEVKGLPEELEKEIGVETRGLPDQPEQEAGVEGHGIDEGEDRGIDESEVLGGAAPEGTRPQLEGYLCVLDHLPENSVLARDVYTADGRLFIHAGTILTPRIISILFDLHELEHPVESIWVAHNTGK